MQQIAEVGEDSNVVTACESSAVVDLAPSPVLPCDEQIAHLEQDDALILKIHTEELPPDAYYDALGPILQGKFPGADPALVEHVVALTAAFDTAASFALSFGIAKF